MALKPAILRNEAELEALLVNDPSQIEEGFKVITQQRSRPEQGSRLDILGIDSEGVITLIELKVRIDGGQFNQSLVYYDLILEQSIDWYLLAYKEKISIDIKKNTMPQIFLIAPDFDSQMLLQIKYLRPDIRVRLFRYQVFDVNAKKEIVLNEIEMPRVKEIESKPWSLEDNARYITDHSVRDNFKKATEMIKDISDDIKVDAEGYGVRFWAPNGKKICQIDPKRKSIAMGYKTDTSQKWEWIANIVDEKQIIEIIQQKIKYAYELMLK